ncbi:MAG: alpha/beta hydrolase [bacterium]|nr:alpha/beta hydrolase [bacterium]
MALNIPEAELPSKFFRPVELDVNGEHLAGIRVARDLSKPADFVFLHGARSANFGTYLTFAKPVIDQGGSIVAFNHSGCGVSTGQKKQSSLEKRVCEASAIIDAFANGNPRTVSGSSMGAYVAIKLLEKYPIRNLILYCPAIYNKRAYTIQFDAGFSEIIRKNESWKDTDVSGILENFCGNLLIIIGSEDTVIPRGVIELLDQHSHNTQKKEILVVPGAPHAIHNFLYEHPEKACEIANKVAEFSHP